MMSVAILIFILSNNLAESFQFFVGHTNRNPRSFSLNMRLYNNFDALLFDCDGVIAETERDAHRVTFNQVILLVYYIEVLKYAVDNILSP